jgi:signal transduction histidine kinase
MNELAAELAPIVPALALGASGLLLLPSRARVSGALLLVAATGVLAAVVATLVDQPTVATHVAVGGLLPFPLAVLAYPVPRARHPLDFCLWVTVAAGSVLTIALVAVDSSASGALGSIVGIALVGHGWRVLESGDEQDRLAMLWLSWAALVAAVIAVAVIAWNPDEWTLFAGVLPAAVVAPGMAVGARRPELTNVRSLVVSTVVLGVVTLSYLSMFIGADAFLEVVGIDDVAPTAFAVIGLALAAGFHPLRVVLRGVIDELLFGDRPDPLVAATEVADRVGDDPLLTLRAVREALALPYASLTVDGAELASSGTAVTDVTRVPLRLGDDTIGEMEVGLRHGQLRLSAEDQHVLRIVGALLAQTLRSRSLALQVAESRAAAISAIEDERRRLRRDLHDGLGPTLSGIAHTAAAARNSIPNDPAAADALLSQLRVDAVSAVGEIRRLVYDMRPPALDELGLVAALHQQLAMVRTSTGRPMQVTIHADDLPPLTASVEVAAYRIATEAVTNAARHSGTDQARLELRHDGDHLVVTVRDSGTSPHAWAPGVGVSLMRERSSEVGGTIELTNGQSGSTVRARLPLH